MTYGLGTLTMRGCWSHSSLCLNKQQSSSIGKDNGALLLIYEILTTIPFFYSSSFFLIDFFN